MDNKKIIFFQIGLIIALALTYLGFEWKTYERTSIEEFKRVEVEIEEEMVEITQQEQKLPPPPPPPPKLSINTLNIVDDDTEVDVEIDFSSEADETTEIETWTPPAQEVEEEEIEEEEIFMLVESAPEFPGGDEARVRFLSENLKYPQMAKESGIQGTVYITFVVEKDGRVTDVRILRGIGGGCDEEALRVVRMMPRWKAGEQRGRPVRVQFNLPVKFTLKG